MKFYTLVTKQGTACHETVLTEKEYKDPKTRLGVERQFCTDKYDSSCIADSWIEVKGKKNIIDFK